MYCFSNLDLFFKFFDKFTNSVPVEINIEYLKLLKNLLLIEEVFELSEIKDLILTLNGETNLEIYKLIFNCKYLEYYNKYILDVSSPLNCSYLFELNSFLVKKMSLSQITLQVSFLY